MNELLEKAVAKVSELPARQQEIIATRMLDEVQRLTQRRGHWADVAGRLSRADLLRGESEAFVSETRAFRDAFGQGNDRS